MKKNFVNFFVLIGLVVLIVFAGTKVINSKDVIVRDNLSIYMAINNTVLYSEEKNKNKISAYFEYFPNTKLENYKDAVHFYYKLDANAYIDYEQELDNNKKTIAYYEYQDKVKYNYNTKVHNSKKKYKFVISEDGYIAYAEGYDSKSQKIIRYIEYYENTEFRKNHGANIKMMYYIDDKGYIEYSIEKEQGTGKEIKKIFYEPKTKYDTVNFTHKDKTDTTENIN